MDVRGAKHVYGPVPSRRLGRSLGIDLVPFKTCSYDCIYCQLGRTTNKTTELREYAPVDEVLRELSNRLPLAGAPDFIGLAGSGEPTLNSRIGHLISGIKRMTDVPVAVLTNGSLLWMPEVRASLERADVVLPSLDAGGQRIFERVNRPHRAITFDRMVEGLLAFAAGFRGEIWLEVFVLAGITDRPQDLDRILTVAKRINPARLQLNTVSRPPAEDEALAVGAETLARLQRRYSGPSEVIAERRAAGPQAPAAAGDAEDEILALLDRRPCTVAGLAVGLGLAANEVIKHLDALCARGLVRRDRREGVSYFARVRSP